jgi:hypothetical protein
MTLKGGRKKSRGGRGRGGRGEVKKTILQTIIKNKEPNKDTFCIKPIHKENQLLLPSQIVSHLPIFMCHLKSQMQKCFSFLNHPIEGDAGKCVQLIEQKRKTRTLVLTH